MLLKAGTLPASFIGKKALINYDKLCESYRHWRRVWRSGKKIHSGNSFTKVAFKRATFSDYQPIVEGS